MAASFYKLNQPLPKSAIRKWKCVSRFYSFTIIIINHLSPVSAEMQKSGLGQASLMMSARKLLLHGQASQFVKAHLVIKSALPVQPVVIVRMFVLPAKFLWAKEPSLFRPKCWNGETKLKTVQFCITSRWWLLPQNPLKTAAQKQKSAVHQARINVRTDRAMTVEKRAGLFAKNAKWHPRLLRLSNICQTVRVNIILAVTPGSIAVKSNTEPAEFKSMTETAAKLNIPARKIQIARFSGKGVER